MKTFEPPLDKGIEREVLVLREAGIETFESCEGGNGHAYLVPTVRFTETDRRDLKRWRPHYKTRSPFLPFGGRGP